MEKMKCELLTLDIWDTILRRKCHPDQIKITTAQKFTDNYGKKFRINLSPKALAKMRIECERELGKKNAQNGRDDEYEIHDVFSMWIDNIIDVSKEENMRITEELYQYELQEELENTYLDPEIISLIETIEYKKLALVSDFYTKKDFIQCILEHCHFNKKIDKIYISCECGVNKRSGRIFDYVKSQEKVDFLQWIHIGDNSYSDVEIPKKKAICAIHYIPEKETALRKSKEQEFTWKDEMPKKVGNKNIETFFFGFITWIAENAIKKQIKTIYFFTREGEFYKDIYDEIKRNNPFHTDMPHAEILEVSRLSTFMPSLREISILELMRIWNQYSVQSMDALFKSLHVEVDKVLPYLKKYDIPLNDAIQYPWQDNRVQKLFDDKDFIDLLENDKNIKKELLYTYFENKGWFQSTDKVAIVDIGWRGTIQDNICYLYPNTEIHGYYIGLIPFLSEQPINAYKQGYLNDYESYKMVLMTVTPFEMLCNSPNGSTIEYKIENNQICAIRKHEESEDSIYFSFIKNKQEKIIRKMKSYCQEMQKNKYQSLNYRERAYDAIYHFIAYPDRTTVKAYFNLKHNEEFGVGCYVDKTTRFRPKLMLEALFKKSRRRELHEFLRDTTWAQGYLVKYWLYPLIGVYNWILKKYVKE